MRCRMAGSDSSEERASPASSRRPVRSWTEPAALACRRHGLQGGELEAEELALAPAVGPIEPADPAGAGDRQPAEGPVAGHLAAERVKPPGPAAVRITPPVKDHRADPAVLLQLVVQVHGNPIQGEAG